MTRVTNNLKHRHVSVRTGGRPDEGGDVLVHIKAGESEEVKDFDEEDPFHAGLIEVGDISVRGSGGTKKGDQARQDRLNAAADAAEQAHKEAVDIFDRDRKAYEAVKGTDQEGDTKTTAQAANAEVKRTKALADEARQAARKG